MKLATMLMIAAIGAAGVVQAQNATPTPAQQAARAARQACSADIKSMCSDKTGNRAIMACLRDNHDKLSQGCQDAMAKVPAPNPAPQ